MMIEHQVKVQRYKQALVQWEEEYRCYGPRGTVACNFTGLTQQDIKKLRSMIRKLEKMQECLEREHEKVCSFIYSSNV